MPNWRPNSPPHATEVGIRPDLFSFLPFQIYTLIVNQHLRSISLDLSEWTLYKVVDPFRVLGVPIKGLKQHCYQKELNGEVLSAGAFELKGKRTHIAWGVKSDPHCSFHAPALPDGSWGPTVDGCPEYQVLRHENNIVGFGVDGTVFTAGTYEQSSVFSVIQAKLRQFAPLILFISLAMVWATAKLLIFPEPSAAWHHDNSGVWWHLFHQWMLDFMGGFFLLFGALKVLRLKKFAYSFRNYDLIAKHFKAWGLIYPFVELGLGVLYTLRLFLPATYALTALLLGITCVSIYLKLNKREEVPCACLGGFFDIPLTKVSLVENFVMANMALYMLFLTF